MTMAGPRYRGLGLFGLVLFLIGCGTEPVWTDQGHDMEVRPSRNGEPVASLLGPEVSLHYLGHSAFVLRFDNGVTILTDDGESRQYGVGGVHAIGNLEPEIVIYAHHYARQTRSPAFPNARIVSGGNLKQGDIDIRAIPVTEERPGDNYGYLITYKGFRIFYAGDAQGDMMTIDQPEVRTRLKRQLPRELDLLMVPIDWRHEITPQAVSYVEFLRPKRVIPMHYWTVAAKERFFASLEAADSGYYVIEADAPDCRIFVTEPARPVQVISLDAGPVIGI